MTEHRIPAQQSYEVVCNAQSAAIKMKIYFLLYTLLVALLCCNYKASAPNMNPEKLIYDKDVNSFETIAKIKGHSVEITLNDFLNSQENEAITLSTKILVWLDSNLEKSKAYAASKMLSIRNENLRSEKRMQLQLLDYVKSLKIDGINAFRQGRFSLYFDDNLSEDDYIVVDIGNDFSFGDVYTE